LLDRTTLNRNLKPLEREGLLHTGPGEDQRTRNVKLTSRGTKILQQALPLWLQAQSGVVDILDRRFQRLADDLRQLEKLEIQGLSKNTADQTKRSPSMY
jgi:DNA-binding MarR family transcriptional regulator